MRIRWMYGFALRGFHVGCERAGPASRDWDGEADVSRVAVLDADSGAEEWSIHADDWTVGAFSADGSRIVVGDGTGQLRVLDAATGGTLVGPVAANDGPTQSVSFSTDGSLVLSAGTDAVTRLWRAKDLASVGMFEAAGAGLGGTAAQFVDDERIRMAAGPRVWEADISPESLIDYVCRVTGRDLTTAEWTEFFGDREQVAVCVTPWRAKPSSHPTRHFTPSGWQRLSLRQDGWGCRSSP